MPGIDPDEELRRRNGNRFRYSPRKIRGWTRVFVAILIVFPIVGIVILAVSDSPHPQPVGMTLLVAGFVIPLLGGAIFGGNAIVRHGGWVGVLFFVGFATAVVGQTYGSVWFGAGGAILVSVIGFVLLAASVVAFWVIGWKAKVPMWVQGPFLGSPRLYVRGRGRTGRDATLPNELDDSDGVDGKKNSAR